MADKIIATIIPARTKTQKEVEKVFFEVKESQHLWSSQLATLSHMMESSNEPATIEGLSFDKHVIGTELKGINAFQSARNIGVLDLGRQEWCVSQIRILTQWLKNTKSVHYLTFYSSVMTLQAWELLCSFIIENNIKIKHISLGSAKMTLGKAKALATLLAYMKTVEKLDLHCSTWSRAHVKVFVWSLLAEQVQIKRFSLGCANLSDTGFRLLMENFIKGPQRCLVSSTGAQQLSDARLEQCLSCLSGRPSVGSFIFNNQTFNHENTQLLARLLLENTSLRRVAFIHCVWCVKAMHVPDEFKEKSAVSVDKIYFDKAPSSKSGQLISLIDLGYCIDQEINSNVFWLKKK